MPRFRATSFQTTAALLTSFALLGAAACSSTGDAATAIPQGLTTRITAVVPDSAGGYVVSLQMTNNDTGSIAYSSGCPFALQVWEGRRWSGNNDQQICRASAKAVDPGHSVLLTVHGVDISSGDVVRTVTPWLYLDGAYLAGGASYSSPVAVY